MAKVFGQRDEKRRVIEDKCSWSRPSPGLRLAEDKLWTMRPGAGFQRAVRRVDTGAVSKGDKPFPHPCSEILRAKLLLGKTAPCSDSGRPALSGKQTRETQAVVPRDQGELAAERGK